MTAPDTGLPVESVVPRLRSALAEGPAVLVAPPGSGKTTVAPLRIVDEPWTEGRSVLVLEPRRVATRAAARRMADLLGERVGGTVGYTTRDDRRVSGSTRIEIITEGVLTRRLQRDPALDGVAAVVFDELHERNLQTDLGLALALDARAVLRPDLRILAMSATIDAERVAALIGVDAPAPVVEADAGIHPVDVRYVPPRGRIRMEDHAAAVVRRALDEEPGDVLVFLPGMGEILRVRDRLGGVHAGVHVLHGSLPADAQDAALTPSSSRKVVLSTDIAESSLTVEGIRVVVDAGLARTPRMDPRTGMTRLHTGAASKASADQRAGRAGRIEPGVAYRLWSKMEQAGRRPHREPEIAQVDLAGLLLEIAAWGTPVDGLAWLDPPPARALGDATDLLERLGALEDGALTDSGRAMVGLPVHPRLARMLADAGEHRMLATRIAALVEGRDVLRGHPDEVPVDVALRVRILEGQARHPATDRRSLDRARREADDLARRIGARGGVDADAAGRVLALAYPDRLAVRRGSPGRFQLRTGTRAWIPPADPLAVEEFVVAADLDGKRTNARIRLAGGIDATAVAERFAHEVDESTDLVWEGDRLVERTERRLGGLVLSTHDRRPDPGAGATDALVDRVASLGSESLPWSAAARSLVARLRHVYERMGEPWPDVDALLDDPGAWLAPHLAGATGWDDVQRLDLQRIVRGLLPYPEAADFDAIAPTHVTVPSGRRVRVDYDAPEPAISVRVQEMFGSRRTPTVAGVPVVLRLLSPADRPVQITSDLAGFWEGTWEDVRRDMAGRYPKHDWPDDPASATPS
ncbi:MAG: ATP-dependent helicase HrpB [Acidimicrobiia bacterium]|nr:ATP-dependent helicase HrpB [Acidimicrobiia bacterium]